MRLLDRCSRAESSLEWVHKGPSKVQNVGHDVVVVLHGCAEAPNVSVGDIQFEAGARLGLNVAVAIGRGSHLKVNVRGSTTWEFIFNASVGNNNAIVNN